MLFDLRSRGRRRTVKTVYIILAFLMGGGLVLFGLGGSVSGGLLDAITQNSGGGGDGSERLQKREQQLVTRTRANPKDATAYAQLARVRVQLASQGDNFDPTKNAYTASGQAELRQAGRAWQKHLALAGEKPDDRVASLMVQAYASLGDAEHAVGAQEVVAAARNAPGPFAQLAVLAYQAGQTRKGDLASSKAVQLTDPDQREAIRGQLKTAKQQALAAVAQNATQNAGG